MHYSSYGEYGGNLSLSPIGSFLGWAMGDTDFGISELEVTIYFSRRRRIPGDTVHDHARFAALLDSLPRTKFQAAKQKLSIQYHSGLKPVKDVLDKREFVPDVFRDALAEMILVFASVEPNLRKKANLAFPAFVEAVRRAAQSLPKAEGALRKLIKEIGERERAQFAALPWDEQLDIDWSEFHPRAKEMLNDPFYWNCVDDNAPHGNDTGADVLELFKEWRAKKKKTSPSRFLDETLDAWGGGAASPALPKDMPSLSQATVELTQDEAAIALAFAQIKLEGTCDRTVRQRALASIERQSKDTTVDSWRDALRLMRKLLMALPDTR